MGFSIRSKSAGKKTVSRATAAVLILTLLTLIMPFPASAAPADDVKIESMTIRIQPEYDDPRVLAVLEPVLSSDTKLPAKAKFFISKKTTDIEVGMACEVPEGQGHVCKQWGTAEAGDWQELSYSVDTARNLFLEYYWDPLKDAKDGKKSFTYEFKSPYAIKKLDVAVQEPLKATDYKIEPAAGSSSNDQEGFKWHTYSFADVEPDQVMTFNVSYTKTDPQPSKQKPNPQQASAQASADQPAGNPNTVRVFLALFVLLLVAGGMAMYWRSQMAVEAPAVRPSGRPKSKGTKLSKTPGPKAKVKFCGNCGSEVNKNNRFCSDCGAEVA